jgi:CysZ protein
VSGIGYVARGFSLILQPGLRRYVIVPLLINVVVFIGLIAMGISYFDSWVVSSLASLPDWLGFLSWLMWIVFVFLAAAFLFVFFTLLANIIAAPFNAILSVRVEERLGHVSAESASTMSLLLVLPRAVAREFSKLVYYLPRLIGLAVLSVIPGVNLLAPPLWLLFGGWMMSVQYADYAADNNGIRFSDLRRSLSGDRINSLGFGLVVYLMMLIPLLNLVLIPTAVAGGTVFWVERLGTLDH